MDNPSKNRIHSDGREATNGTNKPVAGSQNAKEKSRLAHASRNLAFLGWACFVLGLISGRIFLGTVFALLLAAGACTLGIISLLVIRLTAKQLRGAGSAAIAIIVAASFLLFQTVPAFTRIRETSKRISCRQNLEQLSIAILAYAQDHDGYLPNPTKWCDLLIQHDPNIPRSVFMCPTGKNGLCTYGFNKTLDGLRLSDIPEDTVILFETKEGWNITGATEIFVIRHGDVSNILFPEGHVISCRKEDLSEETLRWKN